MKTSYWMGLLFAGSLIAVACGSDNTTTDDDDGTGGSTSSSSSSSTSTSSSSSSSSGSTDCGDLQISEDAACQSCAETSCCAQLLACDIGTECEQLMTCAENCDPNDTTCTDACLADHGAGQSAYSTLFNCLDTSCKDECSATTICDSTLGYPSAVLSQCATDNCCTDFDPCFADTDCNACLQDPNLQGCDTNTLYQAYQTCMDDHCPTGMCDTGIGWFSGDDPIFDCNTCGDTNCCTDLVTCVGGTVPDPPQTAVDLCIACLTDSGGNDCTDAAIGTAADAFNACMDTNCANCSGN